MLKGVLLDVDGTLVLSNDVHARAWVEAFAHYGYSVAYGRVRPLIGMGGDKLIPRLVPDLDSESEMGKMVNEYRAQLILNKYTPTLQPAPGSRALVTRLRSEGIKLVVASSATREELKVLLKAAQLNDLLSEATTSDDAERSKPDPDIIHAALDKIDLPPEQVIMIGDTPYDIEAAAKACVGVVAVRCGGWGDENLQRAIAIYDDPADIVEHYASSPFAA